MLSGNQARSPVDEGDLRHQLVSMIHIVPHGDEGVVFNRDTLSLFQVNGVVRNALANFLQGQPLDQVCRRERIQVENLVHCLNTFFKKKELSSEPPKEVVEEPGVERLVLNVSNDCNLRCKYCYSRGGDYGQERGFMDKDLATYIIDVFFLIFNRIRNIQFFGGEPLLRPDIIRHVCEHIQKRYKKKEISQLPNYGIVTNGTIRSQEIIDLINEFRINLTISLDGPEIVNDYQRGKGTYKKIHEFVSQLKEETACNFGFECTFTRRHLEEGIDIRALMDFFYGEFGTPELHIPLVSAPPSSEFYVDLETACRCYEDAIRYSIQNLKEGIPKTISFATRLLSPLAKKVPIPFYCPAGFSTVSVSYRGNVYPCFMFTGNEEFCLGNVLDDDFPNQHKIDRISQTIKTNDKYNRDLCRECWAQPLCFGCIGGDYFTGESISARPECPLIKGMIEALFKSIADVVGGEKETEMLEAANIHDKIFFKSRWEFL